MKRKGISLIETTIAVSVSSILLLLTIGILHQTLRLSTKAKNRTDFQQSNVRLASQFREDVHRAISADLGQNGSLVLTYKDLESVTYRLEKGFHSFLVRETKASSNERIRQDTFRLIDNCRCEFTIQDDPNRVTLEIYFSPPEESETQRIELRVSATTNRWGQILSKLETTQ